MISKNQRGQGMTEYIIIVALIAVSAIGVYSFFGKTIRNQVAGLASEVSGKDAQSKIEASQTAADKTLNVANQDYNLGSYNKAANKTAKKGN